MFCERMLLSKGRGLRTFRVVSGEQRTFRVQMAEETRRPFKGRITRITGTLYSSDPSYAGTEGRKSIDPDQRSDRRAVT
jgi:hypothetical protein